MKWSRCDRCNFMGKEPLSYQQWTQQELVKISYRLQVHISCLKKFVCRESHLNAVISAIRSALICLLGSWNHSRIANCSLPPDPILHFQRLAVHGTDLDKYVQSLMCKILSWMGVSQRFPWWICKWCSWHTDLSLNTLERYQPAYFWVP